MRRFRFVTVDVFSSGRFGGNQLAIFPDARGLADDEMQSLAAEFNLSETTFVFPPTDPAHTALVRIFNRTYEMPFAGHPNVGTGFVLASENDELGDVLHFEELAGLVEVVVSRDAAGLVSGSTVTAPQPLQVGEAVPPEAVASAVGIETTDLVVDTHQPVVASMGHPFVMIEISRDAMARCEPDVAGFRALAQAIPDQGRRAAVYVYARAGNSLRARMFAPLAGTFEDPATGSAAAPLCAMLLSFSAAPRAVYDVVQGVELGRPSKLRIEAWRHGDQVHAKVGGDCVQVLRGEATL